MGVIAKSEWRGGEQKKLEKLEFDMPSTTKNVWTNGTKNANLKRIKKLK